MLNNNANHLRRIAEDLSHQYHTGTFTAEFKDHLADMIESALRGVVEEAARHVDIMSCGCAQLIRSHFLTPDKSQDKEPQ